MSVAASVLRHDGHANGQTLVAYAVWLKQTVNDSLADSATCDDLLRLSACMFAALPPMNVSSLSTSPSSLRNVSVSIASARRIHEA